MAKGKSGGNQATATRNDEAARQARVRDGTTRVNGIFDQQFTPSFFDAQSKAYQDYATPQITDQRDTASKDMLFSLARSGKLESSTRADLSGELEKRTALQTQKVKDDALGYATKARTGVEDARSNLISTLNATGDSQGAVTSALARASALSQPETFSPISNLFSDFTQGLGTQAAAERAYAYGGAKPTYSTGLFGPKNSAVAVRN